MKKMFEEYGSVAIGLAVTLIFIILLGPVGSNLNGAIKEYVTGFTANPKVDITASVFVDDKTVFGYDLAYEEDMNTIYLDTAASGIKDSDFGFTSLVQFRAGNMADITKIYIRPEGMNGNVIKNGAIIDVTATLNGEETKTSFKVLVLGDADSNGLINVLDTNKIQNYKSGSVSVTDPDVLWAMEIDGDGVIDDRDKGFVSAKITYGPLSNNYESKLIYKELVRNVPYKVNHYLKNVGSTSYTLDKTETFTATGGAHVSPETHLYTGFVTPEKQDVLVLEDGSTVIDYYYARQIYKFTLGSHTGASTSGSSATKNYEYGETITLKATTKAGYTWSKWTSSNTSLVANNTEASTTFTMPAGAIKMTPTVTVNSNIAYTVNHYTYNLDGTTYSLYKTETLAGKTGASVSPGVLSITGFTAPSKQSVTINGDGSTVLDYYYKRNSYSFTLGSATGVSTSGSTISGTYAYGTTITLKATTNAGYTWSKWTSSNTSLVANKSSASATFSMPAGNVEMTPTVASNKFTVVFNANGGSGTMSNQEFEYAVTEALTANSFKRTGYTFSGWATTASGTKSYNDKADGSKLTTTKGGTVNLYAVWNPVSYTITYNLDGGTLPSGAVKSYKITAAVTLPTPTKSNFAFGGWYKDAALTDGPYTTIPKGSYGNVTYYASWAGYLRSTGTQYIKTGIVPDLGDTMEIVMSVDSYGNERGICGYLNDNVGGAESSADSKFFLALNPTKNSLDVGSGQLNYPYAVSDYSTVHTYLIDNYGHGYIDGELFASHKAMDSDIYQLPLEIYLFKLNSNKSAWKNNAAIKVYRFTVYNSSGTARINLIPAVVNGTACMYDTVSKKYFYNAGSGSFIHSSQE